MQKFYFLIPLILLASCTELIIYEQRPIITDTIEIRDYTEPTYKKQEYQLETNINQSIISPPVINYTPNTPILPQINYLIVEPIQKEDPKEIEEFIKWAEEHKIRLIAVNKTVNDFYYNGSKPGDFLDPRHVLNILQVESALLKVPESILKIMEGRTLYLNHMTGRGYTVAGKWEDTLKGIDPGAFIEQEISEVQVIHELGHIIDFNGIQGIYNESSVIWEHLDQLRKEIFKVDFDYNPSATEVPKGFIDVYSTANDQENFAQHFTYYILYAEEFRDKTANDQLLKRKYYFFKDNLFNGKEY